MFQSSKVLPVNGRGAQSAQRHEGGFICELVTWNMTAQAECDEEIIHTRHTEEGGAVSFHTHMVQKTFMKRATVKPDDDQHTPR